jgi:predicted metalloprotease with PDZ domain
MQANINYTITFPEAQAHYADIEMSISNLQQTRLLLKMPVWTPGSYLVREYAKNVEGFSAAADNKPLPFKKTRKNCWQIDTEGASTIKIKYKVYGNEISVRTNLINTNHAFISSAGFFMYPDGMLNAPSTIHIIPYTGWTTVSTSLDAVDSNPFTLYSPDYDTLFDSPIEVGTQEVFSFNAAGVKHEIAMQGGGNYDKERLVTDITKIIEQETAVFGENPNKRYVFIVHNYAKGGGGLEHLSSTVLGATRDAYTDEKGYQSFLTLVSHEYFHLWNVKRLRPIALGPFDYENENYTTELWIAEGFTSYYEDLILRHAGIIDTDNYLTTLANDINLVENQPGRKVLTVTGASFDAWIKAYRPDENYINTAISYYNKGCLIAMLLNLQIINNSEAKYSLDDVMRFMYNEYYKKQSRGYTDTEFKQGLEKFTGNLDDIYNKYVYGLDELDYNRYLNYAGYKLTDSLAETNEPSLGIVTKTVNDKLVVSNVLRGGAAWLAGLNTDDELTTIDDIQITDINTALTSKNPGDEITISFNRDGLPHSLPLTLQRTPQVKYKIDTLDNPNARQLLARKKWLGL